MESVKNLVSNRPNSFEVFGYDLMLDEDLNCWLIEVNSSPDMMYSTKVTEGIVKEVSKDLMNLVFDKCLIGENKRNEKVCGSWELLD